MNRTLRGCCACLLALLALGLFRPSLAGDRDKLQADLTRETGTAPAPGDSRQLKACFRGGVPGRTALVFDLTRRQVLLGERDGIDTFSVLCWQLNSGQETQALAQGFLTRFGEYLAHGTLSVSVRDEVGMLIVRSVQEARAALELHDSPLTHDPDAPGAGENGRALYRMYIGNRNSGIFHYPSCSAVEEMKEENKIVFPGREEAEQAGYRPCRRCRP